MEQGDSSQPADGVRKAVGWRSVAIAVCIAFLLGMAVTWALSTENSAGTLFNIRNADPTQPRKRTSPGELSARKPLATPTTEAEEVAQEARDAVQQVEQVVEQQGGLDSRVAAMEQRLTALDIRAQSASGNAARAEALLIAFASRRVIERGEPLGYLADQLRLRFGEDRPNAVQTVIDASQDPVTLAQLLARLEGIAPQLDDAPEGEGALTRLGRELSELFVVRREETASPVAERRLARARQFLENGQVAPAVSEIRQLPNADAAAEWMADAERFAAAQRALETLETAAVLDPRELRDGAGAPIEQRSPAGNSRR